MSTQSAATKVTIRTLNRFKKDGEKFAGRTSYDYCSAWAANTSGVDVILVGDSLGDWQLLAVVHVVECWCWLRLDRVYLDIGVGLFESLCYTS